MDHKKGHRQRAIERFLAGPELFSTYDVIELLLFVSIPRKDVKELAFKLFSKFKTISRLLSASDEDLKASGVGNSTLFVLRLFFNVALFLAREKVEKRNIIRCFKDLIDYCRLIFVGKDHEEFRVLFLNVKNHVIADEVLSKGTISTVQVYPREVVKRSLELGAASVVITHNHPSGDPCPSRDDIELTKQLNEALKQMNIKLVDHFIVGSQDFFSFAQNKII